MEAQTQTQGEIKQLDEEPKQQVDHNESKQPETQHEETTATTTNADVIATEDEPSSPPNKRHWKKTNVRKKKNKAEDHISDVTQWPTPEEVRNLSSANSSQKANSEPSRHPLRRHDRNSARSRRGTNWKPLVDVSSNGTAPAQSETSKGTTGGGNNYPSTRGSQKKTRRSPRWSRWMDSSECARASQPESTNKRKHY